MDVLPGAPEGSRPRDPSLDFSRGREKSGLGFGSLQCW
jgi:hypothetical protein